jgi:tRNA-specific 2-thiouridylase
MIPDLPPGQPSGQSSEAQFCDQATADPNRPGGERTFEPEPPEPVAVALSGGVDSMVAAFLLKERGYRLLALHMILAPDAPPEPGDQVRRLAERLGLQLHGVDLRLPFQKRVIRPFLDAYPQGKTPNPCVICNPRIKFSLLRERAEQLGPRWLATGHYARLRHSDTDCRLHLLRARDRNKDQSYFLFGLNQAQLGRALFPLGDLRKSQVREIAAAAGLGGYHRPESQEICFIPDNDYRRFLEQHLGEALPPSGPVVDMDGRQVGEHLGIHRFTIGQRRGLGIPSSAAYYVVGLDPETNTVRVGYREDLRGRELLVSETNWISSTPPRAPLEALVRVRYRHREAPAFLEPSPQGVLVRFEQPQMAITPGQAAVFYRGDEVVGGGIIQQVLS